MEAMPASVEGRGPTLAEDPALGLSHRAEARDPRRGPARAVPRRPRPDHRRHRPAPDRHRSQRQRAVHLGRHDLPADVARSPCPFYGKLSDLFGRKPLLMFGISAVPHRLGPVRPEPEHGAADPLPRHPGPRRRRALPDLARRHRRPVHARRARPLPGPVRCRVRHLVHHRPGARRLPDRQRQLALGLLRQHPDRHRQPVSSSGGCCRRFAGRTPTGTSTTSAAASSRSRSRSCWSA